MNEFTNFIFQTLKQASDVANRSFGKVSGVVKPEDNNQVLTETDVEIGSYIVSAITAKFPEHNVIDEEAGVINNGSVYTWVIDPIDGTSNFANGVPTYGVMMGLLHDGQPVAGGIALPFFSEVYIASKGQGTYCNGTRLYVSKEPSLLNSLVAYAIDGHQEDPGRTYKEATSLADIILGIRSLRSSNSAYDLALVANGKYGACLNQTSKIWDNVAPHIIIEEAGGVFTDFYGQPQDYTNPTEKVDLNFTWCTAPPALHAELQGIIHTNRTS
jgi:myo-inositol-1(or 4)-monophosphatase